MIGGSFVWGSGGRRMTPDQIRLEQRIAASLMEPDYSPIQSPWQGLARVAGNAFGALRQRRADQALDANADASQRIMQALMGGEAPVGTLPSTGRPMLPNADGSVSTEESITVTDPRLNGGAATNIPSIWNGQRYQSEEDAVAQALASGQQFQSFPSIDEAVAAAQARSNMLGQEVDAVRNAAASSAAAPSGGSPPASGGAINPAVLQALSDPYVDDNVRQIALLQYRNALEAQNRRPIEPPELVQLIEMSGVDPSSPEGRAMIAQGVQSRIDPIVSIPIPGGVYGGPRSGFEDALRRTQGGQRQPRMLPPDFNFDEGGPSRDGSGGFRQ